MFEKYDQDQSGTLETTELNNLLIGLDLEIDDDSMEACLNEIDTDGSGSISLDEFLKWYLHLDNQRKKFYEFFNNLFIGLSEIKNLEQKDLRTLKFEMKSRDFETTCQPIQASIQLGIAKDVQEPIYSQKKSMGF